MAFVYDTKAKAPLSTSNPITLAYTPGANAKLLAAMIFGATTTQRTGGTPTFSDVFYASKSFVPGQGETDPMSVSFSSDGTKMYIIGTTLDTVHQYTLTTAWDVSTASYANKSFAPGQGEKNPMSVSFSSDGTKMYIIGSTLDTVYQYTLTTAWDVSTASYADKSFAPTQGETDPMSVSFSSDGTKMYIIGQTLDTVHQYTLTTAWDVSTASYSNKSFAPGQGETNPMSVEFSSDGTKMYIIGTGLDTVHQYTLTTAWDVSTASYANKSFAPGQGETNPMSVSFSSDGTKMYIIGYTLDTVHQYTLTTAWSLCHLLTQIGSIIVGSAECTSELWYLLNPPIVAGTICVPNANTLSLQVEAVSFTSSLSPSLFGNTSTNTTGANPQLTLNSVPDGSVVISMLGSGFKDVIDGRSHTEIYSVDETAWNDASQYEIKSGTGNTTHSFTQDSDDVAMIMAAWNEEVLPLSLSGTISAQSLASGETKSTKKVTGALAAQSSVSGNIIATGTFSLAGIIACQSSVSGNITLTGSQSLSGTISAQSTVSGELSKKTSILIHDIYELQAMENDLAADYILANDIDASPANPNHENWDEEEWPGTEGFRPIGDGWTGFSGTFDGIGYDIIGLFINRPATEAIGLFSYIKDTSNITDINFLSANVTGPNYTGILLGYNSGSVQGVSCDGTVVGENYVGGICGGSDGLITNSSSSGSVYGKNHIGGLIGSNDLEGNLNNSFSQCQVTAGVESIFAGGIFGSNLQGSTISLCFSTGVVDGKSYVGGLGGTNENSSIVSNCYAKGAVLGINYVAGLIVENSVNSIISKCYSVGSVTGDTNLGGLVALNSGGSSVTDSFWDIQTSGQETSAGGTGKTTAEMKDDATFTDLETEGLTTPWDFVGNPHDDEGNEDYWNIGTLNDGYPYLSWQEGEAPPEVAVRSKVFASLADGSPLLMGMIR